MPRDVASMNAPPANLEAEMALLGAILHRNSCYHEVADFLQPEDFAQGVHGRIYAAAARLIDAGKTASSITLKDLFEQDDALADVGGFAYLSKLASSVVSLVNSADYGRTIVDMARRRAIISACDQ